MGCDECDKYNEGQQSIAFYRWGKANVGILACPKHAKEIFKVLNMSQKEKQTPIREYVIEDDYEYYSYYKAQWQGLGETWNSYSPYFFSIEEAKKYLESEAINLGNNKVRIVKVEKRKVVVK